MGLRKLPTRHARQHVTVEHRELIRFRFRAIPIAATVAMMICFWSADILLAVYALLLPFYVIPVKVEATAPRPGATLEMT